MTVRRVHFAIRSHVLACGTLPTISTLDTDIPDAVTCGSCRRSRLFASSTATKTVAVPDTEVVPAVRVLLTAGQRVDARAVQAATAALAAPVRLVDRTLMPDGREAWTFVAL